jgi:hypothetical protein
LLLEWLNKELCDFISCHDNLLVNCMIFRSYYSQNHGLNFQSLSFLFLSSKFYSHGCKFSSTFPPLHFCFQHTSMAAFCFQHISTAAFCFKPNPTAALFHFLQLVDNSLGHFSNYTPTSLLIPWCIFHTKLSSPITISMLHLHSLFPLFFYWSTANPCYNISSIIAGLCFSKMENNLDSEMENNIDSSSWE